MANSKQKKSKIIGRAGGLAVVQKYGSRHLSEISKQGHARRKKIIEEALKNR